MERWNKEKQRNNETWKWGLDIQLLAVEHIVTYEILYSRKLRAKGNYIKDF